MPTRVFLWGLSNPVLIVPAATGVVYCNQADGVTCARRELEGYLVPLPRLDSQVFTPDWWDHNFTQRGPGDDDAWAEICDRILHVLATVEQTGASPSKFALVSHPDNCEAWLHVECDLPILAADAASEGVARVRAVLTWENSD